VALLNKWSVSHKSPCCKAICWLCGSDDRLAQEYTISNGKLELQARKA